MRLEPTKRQRMRALFVLALAGVLTAINAIVLHDPINHRDIIALVLSLISLGLAGYQIWKPAPSPAQETIADTVRTKTILWFGLIGILVACVILCIHFIR